MKGTLQGRVSLLIVFLVPVFLYFQTTHFGFTDFDDYVLISVNTSFLQDFGNVPRAFTTDAFLNHASSLYRPMQTVSFMLDSHLSGPEKPWAFHLSSIILFGLASCLLYLFLKKMIVSPRIAMLGALLYSMHPLFISSVAWLPSRGDLLVTCFSLLAVLFFINFLQSGKNRFLWLHWISYTIALFCKETAAFLPFVLILYYFIFVFKGKVERKHFFAVILWGASGIFWFYLRSVSVGDSSGRPDLFGFGMTALVNNIRMVPESLALFILPFNTKLIPSFSSVNLVIGLVLLVLMILVLFFRTERPRKEKVFCVAWFLLFLVPVMLFKQFSIDYLNHRFLLPFIGILLLGLFLIPSRWIRNGSLPLSFGMTALILALGFLTFRMTRPYSDPMSFYNRAVEENPNSALAYNNRGWERMNAQDYAGASEDFGASIRINDKFPDSFVNKGTAELFLKHYPEAIHFLDKSIGMNPKNPTAYFYRGMANAITGNIREALNNFNKAVEINPDYKEALEKRFIAKFFLRDYEGVVEDCNNVLKKFPDDQQAAEYKSKALQELQKKN